MIVLCIVAVLGGVGFIISIARDSLGSSGGHNPLAGSSGSQPTAAPRTVADVPVETPIPTPTGKPKQRSPRDIPDDAVKGSVGPILTGDSLEIVVGERTYSVELAGIAAPGPSSNGDACYEDEAKDELADLLVKGSPIWVSPDPAKVPASETLVAYVWSWGIFGTDTRFVNEELVRGGYARFAPPAFDMGFDEPKRLLQAQADAQRESAGLWGAC